MKIIAALTVPVLALGIGAFTASPASAHTPNFSASCNGIHVGATAYDSNQTNRWSVTINGSTTNGTFGDSFSQDFAVPQNGATTQWSAFVEAQDGSFHGQDGGSVGPCGTPPPVDVCQDLPGDQPAGTSCTPPPDVQRADSDALDGCAVVLDGTTYGAGSLTYDQVYTDTFVFNPVTNTWDLVTDTTPTIANILFTPWSVQEQVQHGCTAQSTQPPALHTKKKKTRIDCGDDVRITTITTTTTPYVYDDATNTWVLGETVTHVTTEQEPVQPGDCAGGTQGPNNPGNGNGGDNGDDTDVAPAQAHTSNSGPQVLPASAPAPLVATVPTAADSGLAGSPSIMTAVSAPLAAVLPSTSTVTPRNAGVATMLLLMAGLAFAGAAVRVRKS